MWLKQFESNYGSFAARLPYGIPWGSGVHRLRNKSLCAVFEVEGYSALTSTKFEAFQRGGLVRQAIDRLGPQWFEEAQVLRREYVEFPDRGDLSNRTLWMLNEEQKQQVATVPKYHRNRAYVGIARRSDASFARLLQQLFGVARTSDEERGDDEIIQRFEQGVSDVFGALKSAYRRVRRVGFEVVEDSNGAPYILDEMSGLFDEIVTGNQGPLAFQILQPPLVNGVIGGVDVISGDFPEVNGYFHAVVSIEGFPPWSIAGIADFLSELPVDSRWWSRFRSIGQSLSLFHLGRRRLAAAGRAGKTAADANPLALGVSAAVANAYGEAAEHGISFGYYSGGVVLRSKSVDDLRNTGDELVSYLRKHGFAGRRESRVAFRALLGSYFFNERIETRASFISGIDAVNFFPLSAEYLGSAIHPNPKYRRQCGENLPAERVVISLKNTPVDLSPFTSDNGHCAFVGPVGAGKSTGIKATMVNRLMIPKSLIVQLDSNYNSYILNRALGGIHIDISGENSRPLICPAARIADGLKFREKFRDWFEDTAALHLGEPLNPDEVVEVRLGVDRYASSGGAKNLSQFRLAVQGPRLHKVIDEFAVDKNGYALLDAPMSLLPKREDLGGNGSQLITIEVGDLSASPRRLMPVLMALFDWMEWLLNGDPFTCVADETHKFFHTGRYARRFEKNAREFRKLNGSMMLASQYYEDFAVGDLAVLLGKAIRNWYFLPNPEADTEAYADRFLQKTEQLLVKGLRQKDQYFFKHPSGSTAFSYKLGPVELALGREDMSDIAAFREIEAAMVAKNAERGVGPDDPDYQDYSVPLWLEHCGVENATELGKQWVAGSPQWRRSQLAQGLRPRVTVAA